MDRRLASTIVLGESSATLPSPNRPFSRTVLDTAVGQTGAYVILWMASKMCSSGPYSVIHAKYRPQRAVCQEFHDGVARPRPLIRSAVS